MSSDDSQRMSLYAQPQRSSISGNRLSVIRSNDHNGEINEDSIPQRDHCSRLFHLRIPTGWRGGLLLNIFLATFILIINISFFAWAVRVSESHSGVVFRGSCEKTRQLATCGHVVVNILSAVLLSASNYTMQVLASPKRADVDSAHQQRRSLTIGVPSFKNLRSVGYFRAALWCLLLISSVPLHLLYNSVISAVSGEYAYMVAVASADFKHGAPFTLALTNRPQASYSEPLFSTGLFLSSATIPNLNTTPRPLEVPMYDGAGQSALLALQKKAERNELLELSREDCLIAYLPGHSGKYGNIVAISDKLRSNSSVVWIYYSTPANKTYSTWICTFGSVTGTYDVNALEAYEKTPSGLLDHPCVPERALEIVSDWSLGLYIIKDGSIPWTGMWKMGSHPISRCLVEPIKSPCGLIYENTILVIVITANLVKILGMAMTMYQYKNPALVTIGDALATFLEDPDPTTQGNCLAKEGNFANEHWIPEARMYSKSKEESLRSAGASHSQWVATSVMFSPSLVFGSLEAEARSLQLSGFAVALFFIVVYKPQIGPEWLFGSSIKSTSVKWGRELGLSHLIILANIPQLILSIDYLLFNRLITCIAGSREWSLFAHQRKALRTSVPQGSQRSTYWLQLPLKFSIPLMGLSTALHYLASQSLYFGSVQYYDYYDVDGARKILEDYTGLGYSPTAAHVLMIGLLLPMAIAVMLGRQRNKLGIPPSGFNSAVISAACHPPAEEEDVHLKPVQWGEVPQHGGEHEIGHCSFSSEEVTMPVVGKEYA